MSGLSLGLGRLGLGLAPNTDGGVIVPPFLRGINFAGQESGGSVFAFPSHQAIDYFAAKGVKVFRVPVRMERLIASPGGDLQEPYATYLQNHLDYLRSKGIRPIFDPHNFGRFLVGATVTDSSITGGTSTIVGQDTGFTAAHFADFHAKCWRRFGSPEILWGLMNEPHGQDDALLLATHQAAITALRAIGCRVLILVNGNNYNSYAWDVGSANRTYMVQISDPLKNWAVDLHHYFDASGAGQSTTLTADPLGKLTQFTPYARAVGLRAFVGEFGAGSAADNLSAIDELVLHLEANTDVYTFGYTYWDAVQYQDNYMYQILPTELSAGGAVGPYTDRAQMDVLETYFAGVKTAPSFLANPTISGAAVVGVTLSSMIGQPVGFPAPALSYQWYQDTTPIIGATGRTYTIVSGDAGHTIKLRVTATNSEGSISADSTATATVIATTTWDAATKSATVLLSNGNLTATRTGAGSGTSVKSNNGASTGKKFCSFLVTTTASGLKLGLVDIGYVAGATSNGTYVSGSGVVWCNGVQLSSSLFTAANGDVIDVAVDLDTKKIWVRRNGGNWDNNVAHDPATNAGGYSFSSLTAPFSPAASFDFCGPVTANFGDSAYTYAAPSGFGKW